MRSGRPFEVWYRDSYARLSTAMLALTGDRDIASDATDEAFSRAWRHWDQVQGMVSPEGWSYRVALNVVRTRARRRRIEQRLLPRLVSRTTVSAPAGEVWELVRELAPRQRVAVVLRYVADLDERAIAEAARRNLGIAVDANEAAEERS